MRLPSLARICACNSKFVHGSALRTYREMGTVLAADGPGGRPFRCGTGPRLGREKRGENAVLKRMTKLKLAFALIATALAGAGVGASVIPASADQRTLVVTLATGQTMTVTVDVPPGTPVDQIHIPGVSTPIVGVSEVSQPSPPPPADQPAPAPAPPSATVQTQPEAPSAAPQSGQSNQQQAQQQTGKTKRKARDKV